MEQQVVTIGTVMSVCDEYHGDRIKVKLPSDPLLTDDEKYPWAFPLLPKTLHIIPKKGEMVFVISSAVSPSKEPVPRYYIGPIISQPQTMYKDTPGSLSTPLSLISSLASPYQSISNDSSTFGSFPKVNDIAIEGRKGEDVILKDDEINIRCGARNYDDGTDISGIVGQVIFNSSNPAYIQLKHRRGRSSRDKDNLINMVGSGINLMSNEDAHEITEYMRNYNDVGICKTGDSEKRIANYVEPDYDDLMNKLHEVPYGDVLVQVLEIIRKAIQTHTHPWAQEPPTSENVPEMVALNSWGQSTDDGTTADLSDILLSDTVRIS